jgi:hypothetical protein
MKEKNGAVCLALKVSLLVYGIHSDTTFCRKSRLHPQPITLIHSGLAEAPKAVDRPSVNRKIHSQTQFPVNDAGVCNTFN